MPTIRDLAQAADVLAATVSHVINETRFVSDAPRQHVHTVIDRLGYQPNALARGLRHGHAHTLGMILPDSANPFTTENARSIEHASFTQSYSAILCNTNPAVLFSSDRGGTIGTKHPKPITARVNRL